MSPGAFAAYNCVTEIGGNFMGQNITRSGRYWEKKMQKMALNTHSIPHSFSEKLKKSVYLYVQKCT